MPLICLLRLVTILKFVHRNIMGPLYIAALQPVSRNPSSQQSMSDMKPPTVDYQLYQDIPTARHGLSLAHGIDQCIVQDYRLQRHVLDEFAAQYLLKADAAAAAAGTFVSEMVLLVGSVKKDDGIRPSQLWGIRWGVRGCAVDCHDLARAVSAHAAVPNR
jgi:hypothetical protein